MFENLPKAFQISSHPLETRATCSACVMARADWPRDARDAGPFSDSLKCCTYAPFLPNFTIGELLKEGGYETRLEAAVQGGRFTPLGLMPQSRELRDFGRDQSARCPFLTSRLTCSIWQKRPTVCRTYFCVSDRGSDGQLLWRALETKGNELEWRLAHEVLWQMGFTQDEVATWAEWKGREHEFYLECAKRVLTVRPEPGDLTALAVVP